MTTDFLWGGRAEPTRGPKPALSLARIADAAIAVADADGLAAVSMQRVAADLGFTKMSLYRYLPHPWALAATVGHRPVGPNELGWLECAVALLAGTGLTGGEQLDTVAVLAGQVRMIAQQAAASRAPAAEFGTAIADVLVRHGERFPALVATMADAAGGRDAAFDFGLDRILAGLRALIDERRPRREAGAG